MSESGEGGVGRLDGLMSVWCLSVWYLTGETSDWSVVTCLGAEFLRLRDPLVRVRLSGLLQLIMASDT